MASVTAAGTATVAGLGGRYLTERTNVTQAQRALRVPAPATLAPPLPAGSDLKIPGLSPFVTPNKAFYRVDTAIVLPEILPSSWHLRIHGMVQREINLTFDQLIRRPLQEDYVTLDLRFEPGRRAVRRQCPVARRERAEPAAREAADPGGRRSAVPCTSQDGFIPAAHPCRRRWTPSRDAMLAVAMNGQALPVEHGFPVRMVVPACTGTSPACKWITDIEVTTPAGRTSPTGPRRGWSQPGDVRPVGGDLVSITPRRRRR